MTGLVHISEYLNEFKVELDTYEKALTEKAEEVSTKVKEIQKKLSELEVEPFHLHWDEEIYDEHGGVAHCLCLGLSWNKSKVMFLFEDTAETVLGTNRHIRADVRKHLDKKTEELLN